MAFFGLLSVRRRRCNALRDIVMVYAPLGKAKANTYIRILYVNIEIHIVSDTFIRKFTLNWISIPH